MPPVHQGQQNPAPESVLRSLCAQFEVFRKGLPLCIGIHTAIRERLPDLGRGQLGAALKRHTASTRYLKALTQGSERFDLDGNPAGLVTPEQREQAATALRDRFKRGAEKRRAELQEKALQKQEKARQEKLFKLAEKFNQKA